MGKKTKSKREPAMSESKPTPPPAAAAAAKNGTLHVTVLRARDLPTMDFGKRQDPFGELFSAISMRSIAY